MEKQNRRKINNEFKRMVVKEVISGKVTKEAARRIYGIKGKSAVTDWVRFYVGEKEMMTVNAATLEAMTAQEREQFEMLKRLELAEWRVERHGLRRRATRGGPCRGGAGAAPRATRPRGAG